MALDAASGKEVWERACDSDHSGRLGPDPRSASLIVGDKIYTVGNGGAMHSLNKKTGAVNWTVDLMNDFTATSLGFGYAASPVAYEDKIILPIGGENNAMVALYQKDGTVAWNKQSFENSYATPKLIEVDRKTQLICWMATELVSLNPETGELLWTFNKVNQWKLNIFEENGNLALAAISPKKMKVLSKVQILEKEAWTVPTVVGRTMFIRDGKNIMALNLGVGTE